jgi:hypothetical protein
MMGLYVFASQVLSWLPPTVFTIMNEFHVSMYYGLGSLSIYFLLSIVSLSTVGDYPRIVASMHYPDPPLEERPDEDETYEMVHHRRGNGATTTYASVAKDDEVPPLEDQLMMTHALT